MIYVVVLVDEDNEIAEPEYEGMNKIRAFGNYSSARASAVRLQNLMGDNRHVRYKVAEVSVQSMKITEK